MSDVIVLGGGPAGAAASLLLASWGHRVRLITKAGVEHSLAVSLPPSCEKIFSAIGVSDAVERANFLRSTGNTVWWGGSDARVEPFVSGARGWQVDVARLAEVILQRAAAAGVAIERQMVVDPPRGFVIDCTGRAGVIARTGPRRQHDGPRTIALVGEWHRDSWPVPDDTHTLIESYDDGWMWSVPIGTDGTGTRHIAAMVDPQRSGLARGGSSKDVYLAEIRKTREFKRLTADATLRGGPWGWDATQYDAVTYASPGWLLAGDAGSFIDPLSSAGVKKALASGWLAAIVAHTALKTPSMKAHALAFFNERESRRFLAEAAPSHRPSFWDPRTDDLYQMFSTVSDPTINISAVREAFESLKASDRLRARLGPGISIEPRPMIRGNEIVLEPHLVPAVVRYVSGIDIVALAELAPSVTQVPDLYDAYVKRAGTASLHDFLQALATAVAKGWLVAE